LSAHAELNAIPLLENLVKHSQFKPTKIELELSFDSFPNHKIMEVWWFQNANQFKLQTVSVGSDWLFWESLYKFGKKLGPIPTQTETIKASHLLTEQIFFYNLLNSITQALAANSISTQNLTLSRQQGRVAIKFPSTQNQSEAALWIDQQSGEVSRIFQISGCDVTYSLSGLVSQYPKSRTYKWINFSAQAVTKSKSEITKFEPIFFEQLSGKYKEAPETSDTSLFLEHLKQFYKFCR
jgi:hypothetical protein